MKSDQSFISIYKNLVGDFSDGKKSQTVIHISSQESVLFGLYVCNTVFFFMCSSCDFAMTFLRSYGIFYCCSYLSSELHTYLSTLLSRTIFCLKLEMTMPLPPTSSCATFLKMASCKQVIKYNKDGVEMCRSSREHVCCLIF